MMCGIFTRWKQIVAYYYTPGGFDGTCLKDIILQIIEKAELIGLKVHSVTSDMGAANQAMWRAFSYISATKYSIIKTRCHIHWIIVENCSSLRMLHTF
ncbi:hypothetical protein X777_04033 [Ooceraea biroi]|uniref:Transposable element P transposase-like RNase H domain-containing protein n=1 Tax=Ooceraea biroi TaxID=2015173 RepID=A0A026WJ20_OOCBI|nr:hypothetical protein X777_04033 [Ooceraea biroi]